MAYKVFTNGTVLDEDDLNDYLMRQAVVKCTSGTRPSSPDEGMVVDESDTDLIKRYNGSAWRRYAIDLETHTPVAAADTSTISGITSTSWAAGSPVVGVAFTAPPSGSVFVTVSGTMTQSNNGFETRLSWEMREGSTIGSGTVFQATSSLRAVVCGRAVNASGPAMVSASYRRLVPGLTAGSSYNARCMYSVSGGTGGFESREITIEPVH